MVSIAKYKDIYYEWHCRCPNCNRIPKYQTYMLCLGEIDDNEVKCECGWEGIVNELVKEKTEQ